nr:N-acetylneuraminate synthase family protein [Acetatifactor sp.]
KTFKERYHCVVGYSGHEQDLEPTVVAVTLGAKVIERHVTLSHEMWGTDQKASLEVAAMGMLAGRVRTISEMLGNGVRFVNDAEREVRKKLRGV